MPTEVVGPWWWSFFGKDASKVDRSAAYTRLYCQKPLAGAWLTVLVQVAYAIGVARPVGFYINTFNTSKVKDASGRKYLDSEIAQKVQQIFDLRPFAIIQRFGLTNPIFKPTAAYGHFGRDPYQAEIEVNYSDKDTFVKEVNGRKANFKKVEFFAWEKLDYVEKIKSVFNL